MRRWNENHSTRTLELFCAKSHSEKHQVFEKWDDFKNRPSCKGYIAHAKAVTFANSFFRKKTEYLITRSLLSSWDRPSHLRKKDLRACFYFKFNFDVQKFPWHGRNKRKGVFFLSNYLEFIAFRLSVDVVCQGSSSCLFLSWVTNQVLRQTVWPLYEILKPPSILKRITVTFKFTRNITCS